MTDPETNDNTRCNGRPIMLMVVEPEEMETLLETLAKYWHYPNVGEEHNGDW
jgi:hypothetical protein